MLNSLTSYLSATLFHGLDKRWIFLVCNGILVVVATTSAGLVSSPPEGFDLSDMTEDHVTADGLPTPEEPKDVEWLAEPVQNAASQAEEKEDDQETLEVEDQGSQDDQCFEEEPGGGDHLILIEENDERSEQLEEPGESTEAEAEEIRTYHVLEETLHPKDEENLEAAGFLLGEEVQVEEEEEAEEEEEEEHGMEQLSTEELNKKFEDFIRKMKEELRIEAQQQLVLVK